MEEDRGGTHGDGGAYGGLMLALSHGALCTVANGLRSMGGGMQLLRGGWHGRDVDVLHTCFTRVAIDTFPFVCLWQRAV